MSAERAAQPLLRAARLRHHRQLRRALQEARAAQLVDLALRPRHELHQARGALERRGRQADRRLRGAGMV